MKDTVTPNNQEKSLETWNLSYSGFSYHIKDIVNKDVKQLDNDASHI